MTSESLPPLHTTGAVIDGRYELIEVLGRGGMGSVWRALHTQLRTPVAVKFIDPRLVHDESITSRFLLEARSAAALRSTHIVQVFDFGLDDQVPYIAMELLAGESLGDRLERGPIQPREFAPILAELALAMGYAHQKGVIHRDLKPDNIFLANEGGRITTKVLDFGVAKVAGDGVPSEASGATRTGALMGTPFYVSPEQARGNKSIDFRTDLWALGVITYEAIVGERPFDSDGLGDLLMKICGESYTPLPKEHQLASLAPFFDRALHREPEMRFQSAAALAHAFEEMALGRPLPASERLALDATQTDGAQTEGAREVETASDGTPGALEETRPPGTLVEVGDTNVGLAKSINPQSSAPPSSKASPQWFVVGLAALILVGLASFVVLNSGKAEGDSLADAPSEQEPVASGTSVESVESPSVSEGKASNGEEELATRPIPPPATAPTAPDIASPGVRQPVPPPSVSSTPLQPKPMRSAPRPQPTSPAPPPPSTPTAAEAFQDRK